MAYFLRPRKHDIVSDKTTIQKIPDIFGDIETYVSDKGYIDAEHLCKKVGLHSRWSVDLNSKKWISSERLVEFASMINEEWGERLLRKYKGEMFVNYKRPERTIRKRDKKLRKKHACTLQTIYGAMIGKNRLKIGCTDTGFVKRMVDLGRKVKTYPYVVFVYKVKNPKMAEKRILDHPFVNERKGEYKGIKNEVILVRPDQISMVKKIAKKSSKF